MDNYCGADCSNCGFKDEGKGCTATCGSPFGGRCVAAEYIKIGGCDSYNEFKAQLLAEINALLREEGLTETDALHELAGSFVNIEYTLPSGEKVKMLNDRNIYLGTQIEFADLGVCYGVVADTSFILICSYSVDGSEPEIVIYKRR
ncbi:MAG: DUF3795 domain-containing protein [Ruminococcus sp.]|nr:DUF3795 domain-containing protein [Ruminococcus sp.]